MGKGSENSIYISERQVERVISKSQPLFASFMVESSTCGEVKPMHHLVESLLREFVDIFPMIYPLGFLL